MKSIIFSLILFLLFVNLNKANDNSSCTVYINIQSPNTKQPCGETIETACQEFLTAVQSCNTTAFNTTTYYFSPATYSFEGIDPFGSIVNKTINIINQEYSVDKDTSYTSVIFDLKGATNSFFNVQHNLISDISNINITGITFINGYQESQASVFVNHGTYGTYSFESCVFENNTMKSGTNVSNGGSFSVLQSSLNDVVLQASTLNINKCTFQNTSNMGVTGGLFYIDNNVRVVLNIEESSFTNINGDYGSILYNGNKLLSSTISISNTVISKCIATNSTIYLVGSTQVYNVTFSDNTGGGVGFQFTSSSAVSTLFSYCNFIDNVNITPIYSFKSGLGVSLYKCVFSNNYYSQTVDRNGALTLSDSTASVSYCQFYNNYAINGSSIYATNFLYNDPISIFNSSFVSNTAQYGGVFISQGALFLKDNTTFANNIASFGSAISCFDSTIVFNQTSIITFTNNTDTNGGNNSNGLGCGSNSGCVIKGNIPNNIDTKTCGVVPDKNEKPGLSAGKKALIAIAIVAFVIILIVALIFTLRKIKQRGAYKPIGTSNHF
ncbi:hypothetical protein DICPUDRAFT_99893 [Dictyostelium purpureum]|uniref:Right handed beta helix domain-containing protein n=1 Tax=Dictyostelium purpureum TaxID=5786 RepID=F1A3J4_DICPU|nr:uncharacterized protein DICPUDRAFT_99893 [Dictyostelium purpureum]EGC29232.1 hypothetical protein DICPUDRAFT_99893 [Dictyostelium purpureum]|eukprot:XP_003294236.1 hypothetical protein DICPUDRAFT_99893 [Dictyostelium purpureum]